MRSAKKFYTALRFQILRDSQKWEDQIAMVKPCRKQQEYGRGITLSSTWSGQQHKTIFISRSTRVCAKWREKYSHSSFNNVTDVTPHTTLRSFLLLLLPTLTTQTSQLDVKNLEKVVKKLSSYCFIFFTNQCQREIYPYHSFPVIIIINQSTKTTTAKSR